MRDDTLAALPAVEQRRLIGRKAVSPVELLQACIARIDALNPGVNALAATDFDRALAQARDHEPMSLRASSGIVGAVRQVADEEGVPLVDWEAWLRTGSQQTRWFTDNVHLQPDAHIALAKLATPTVKAAIAARSE